MRIFSKIPRVSHSHNAPVPDVHSARLMIAKGRLILRIFRATVKAQHTTKK
jgi:hypothetical protein